MRNKKRCIAQFTFYDRTGIQAYLEKMTSKGWLLEKMSTYFWTFKRIEPSKIHFAVTYFPKGSEFDPEPTEGQKRLIEYCESAGWRFIASTAQLQIFYSEMDEPVPIETDARVELENIHGAAKRNFLIAYFVLLGLAVLNLVMLAGDFTRNPLYVLGSNSKLFSLLSWSCVLVMCIVELAGYFIWYRRAKKAVEMDGSFVATKGIRVFQLTMLTIVMFVFALYLLSLGEGLIRFTAVLSIGWIVSLFLLVNLVKNTLKKHKASRDTARIVTFISSFVFSFGIMGIVTAIVFQANDKGWFEKEAVGTYEHYGVTRNIYHDELPLIVEDMIPMDYDGYSYEMNEEASVFLKDRVCT